MYYRRKIILSLLQVFDNKLEKIRLQKLLLLFSKLQTKPDYHFVPYKYGCFSFQANADLTTLVKNNQVVEEINYWRKTDTKDYISELREHDRYSLQNIKRLYGNKPKNELLKITYIKYPYFAINSIIAHEVLSADEYYSVAQLKPQIKSTVLFTIGYEGVSLEEYINKLIVNGIKVLCDVRKNALSMKYGFSKSQLKNAAEGVGIKYVHLPDLGIESDKRKKLRTQSDYDNLFLQYRKTVLTKTHSQQERIIQLLNTYKHIALTCFEANICQCHRKHLAESIIGLCGCELKHI